MYNATLMAGVSFALLPAALPLTRYVREGNLVLIVEERLVLLGLAALVSERSQDDPQEHPNTHAREEEKEHVDNEGDGEHSGEVVLPSSVLVVARFQTTLRME